MEGSVNIQPKHQTDYEVMQGQKNYLLLITKQVIYGTGNRVPAS